MKCSRCGATKLKYINGENVEVEPGIWWQVRQCECNSSKCKGYVFSTVEIPGTPIKIHKSLSVIDKLPPDEVRVLQDIAKAFILARGGK